MWQDNFSHPLIKEKHIIRACASFETQFLHFCPLAMWKIPIRETLRTGTCKPSIHTKKKPFKIKTIMSCTRANLYVINLSGSVQLKNGSMILEQLAAWLGKEGVAPSRTLAFPSSGHCYRLFLCSALHNLIHSRIFWNYRIKKNYWKYHFSWKANHDIICECNLESGSVYREGFVF